MSTGVRASLVDKVMEMAQKHKVVVFAKSYCPYCMQVGLCHLLKSYILPPVSSMAHRTALQLHSLLPAVGQAWSKGSFDAATAAAAARNAPKRLQQGSLHDAMMPDAAGCRSGSCLMTSRWTPRSSTWMN